MAEAAEFRAFVARGWQTGIGGSCSGAAPDAVASFGEASASPLRQSRRLRVLESSSAASPADERCAFSPKCILSVS